MKKRNFKQLFKVILEGFAYAIWLLLISISIVYVVDGHSAWLKATLIVISVAYTGASIAMVSKSVDKNEKQKAEDKNKKLQELKIQDKYYIDLVDSQVEKTLNKLKNELLNVEVDKSLDYLISFSNKVNWICNTKIIGKPDSFIIASCLMYSLISHPVITVNNSEDSEYLKATVFSLNLDIAMNCVFEIISEPSTYFEDSGIWVEEKHPKVNIVVPNGLIKNSELYKRIINTIYRDELAGNRTSIMQFSNLLHLIYLNCQ